MISFGRLHHAASLLAILSLATIMTCEECIGIPAFARAYRKSCSTCHYAIPKLNAFGEAVRRGGYRLPPGTEIDSTAEEQINLGAEGYKKVWPDAIWPGAISPSVPLAVEFEAEATYRAQGESRWDFSSLEGEVELLTGGTLGEGVGFFGEVGIEDDLVEIERAFVLFTSIVGPYAAFNVKVGKFEPNAFSVTNVRRITPRYWITTRTIGDNQWSLEGAQRGLEFNGILADGRFSYNAGVIEGRSNLQNNQKDVYAHASYKFGGLRLNGISEHGDTTYSAAMPWRDNSIAIGAFGYVGTATLATDVNDRFTMIGGDINAYSERLNAVIGFARQSDDQPLLTSPNIRSSSTHWFVETAYLIYPWLIPVARFESYEMKNAGAERRIVGAVNMLYRANVKLTLQFGVEKKNDQFDIEEVTLAFLIGV